ncbi:MAG: hypothetical protein JXJ19_03395 [Elusimicrobia bacterium]|nr:hypothetical protein [Elusimicrobiota bacterium]
MSGMPAAGNRSVSAEEIDRIKVSRIKIPLKAPYRLSYATLEYFDTFLVEAVLRDGRRSCGETTFLEGYSSETAGRSAGEAEKIIGRIRGIGLEGALSLLRGYTEDMPFLISGIITALEGFGMDYTGEMIRMPVIALMNGMDEEEIEKEAEGIKGGGYSAVKIKVGLQALEKDIDRIRMAREYLGENMRIRVDANQSLSFGELETRIKKLADLDIEYIEQPFPRGAWDEHAQLNGLSGVRVMLDESVWTVRDLEKTARTGAASHVKLKLQKCGGYKGLCRMIKEAMEKGLEVIIGNGVQTDLVNFMEARAYRENMLMLPGENIGFTRMRKRLLKSAAKVKNGMAEFADEPPVLSGKFPAGSEDTLWT